MEFNELAKQWDTEEAIDRAKLAAEEIRKHINLNKEMVALDFGCGTGLLSFNLFADLKQIDLLDTSTGMLEVADGKIEELNVSNMNTINHDLGESNLSKKYDLIYTLIALHHVIDYKEMIGKFSEHLNEGGKLCIIDLNPDFGAFHYGVEQFNGHDGFEQSDLKAVLESKGLKNVKSETYFEGEKNQRGKDITYSLFIMTGEK